MSRTVNSAAIVIRQRVRDRDKINYADDEIINAVATACRYLSQVLIARRSPEMIATATVSDDDAVPATFHSFVGQYPVWREGSVFRTSVDDPVAVRYWATRGQDLDSLSDELPFPDIYFDAIVTVASMLLLNRDEFDLSFEDKLTQTLEALMPGGAS